MPVDLPLIPTATATRNADSDCRPQPLTQTLGSAQATELAALAKALSDPIRMQIVDILRAHSGDVCQCELHASFGISQPTLSHHLRKLTEAGIIETERRGVWAYYSIRPQTLQGLQAWLLAGDAPPAPDPAA